MSTQPIAVVVLAAGAGTRMKSHLQKTLHVIGGRSFLSHSLHSAAGITPQQIVAVIGHRREQVGPAVAEVAKELPVPVSTAIQEEQNGTGHAMQLFATGRVRLWPLWSRRMRMRKRWRSPR